NEDAAVFVTRAFSPCARLMHGLKARVTLSTLMFIRVPVIVLLIFGMLLPPAWGQAGAKNEGLAQKPNQVRGDEITPAQRMAVGKGLNWLAAHQGRDGSFGGGGLGRHSGITALAGLAFMQSGSLPGRGKYGDNVSRALDFVLQSTQESGLIASDQSNGP